VDGALRVHQGPVDQSALTSRDPVAVFREVQRALWDMGIEARRESETTYKLECVRRKRAKTLIDIGQSIKTSVFPPSQADYDRSASNARLPSSPSSMLSPSQSSVRNFLRRNSSQHSADTHMPPPTYGEPSVDNGGEVRFSVELTKLRLLPGLYIVDLKRMRGNIWAYKHLNRSLLGRLDLVGPTAGQIASSSAN
jgi:protein-serine/threonine kinase